MSDGGDSSGAGTAPDDVRGWERNERDRRLIGLDATPSQRLAWLEEMLLIAHRIGALPRPADVDPTGTGRPS
jgi:hypothetical protein